MIIAWSSGPYGQSSLFFPGSISTWAVAGVTVPVFLPATTLRFLTHATLYLDSGTVYWTDQEHPDFLLFIQQLTASARITTRLPDPASGVPLARSVSLSCGDLLRTPTTPTVSAMLALADISGTRAHIARWDTQLARYIAHFDGEVQEPDINERASTLTITEDQDALTLNVPQRLILNEFPSADFSSMQNGNNAPVRVVWGVAPRVELALCVKTFIVCQFTIDTDGGTVNKYLYKRDTTIPNVLVPEGARLVYNVRWFGPSAGVKISLYNGVDLLHGTGATDQNGISCHPNTDIPDAEDKFTRLDIPLPSEFENTTITHYLIGYERTTAGGSANAWISDAAIVDRYGAVLVTICGENVENDFSTTFLENPEVGIDNTAVVQKFAGWEWGAIRTPVITSRALFFNGAGSWTIANPSLMGAKTFTAVVPVFCGFGGSIMHVFGRQYTSGDGWQIGISTSGKAACRVYTGGGTEQVLDSTDTVGDAASWHWISLAVDDDAKVMKVIIDEGNPDTFTYTGSVTTGGGTFTLANTLFSRAAFVGYIGPPVIYERFLSDNEIRRHYNARKTGQELGLVGYWPLEEGTGSTTTDIGPREATGTLSGHVWDTGPTWIPNIVNEVYEDGAVIPRELWQPALWGADLLIVRQFTAPRNAEGRLPRLQADLISAEFAYSPGRVAQFFHSDSTYLMGRSINAESFALAIAQYKGLVPPSLSSVGYRIDGALIEQIRARDLLPEILLHGAYTYKDEDEETKIALDLPNYAFLFDGATKIDFGTIAGAQFSGMGTFTIQFYITLTSVPGSLNRRILTNEITSGGLQGIIVFVEATTGKVCLSRYLSGAADTLKSAASLPVGIRTHVAFTFDGTSLRLYLDADEESTSPVVCTQSLTTFGALKLGCGDSSEFLSAEIDEIRMSSTAWSQADIETWMRRELDGIASDLKVYVQFNEIGNGVLELVTGTWGTITGSGTHAAGGAFWDDPVDPDDNTIALGDGDFGSTQWQNVRLTRYAEIPLTDYTNRLELSGGENPGFEGTATYDVSTFRTVAGRGKTTSLTRRFIRDWFTLDRECKFLIETMRYARRFIEVNAHHSARLARLGQRPALYIPNKKIDGERFKIAGIDVQDTIYRLTLRGWNIAAYPFIAGQASAPTHTAGLTDYSQTLPDTPILSPVTLDQYVIADNGNVTVRATVEATVGDTPNITNITFLKLDTLGMILATRTDTVEPGDTKSVIFDNLEMGQDLLFTAYVSARNNKPGFQDSARATSEAFTVPSLPGPPNAPTGLAAATTPGAVVLAWTNPSNKNLGAIEIHRSLADSFSDDTTRIDTITKVAGSESLAASYIDTSGTYDQVYYYNVRAVNTNSEKSGFATSISAAAPKVTSTDRQDINFQTLTGGVLAAYTRRVMTYAHGLGLQPLLSTDQTSGAEPAILAGPWTVTDTFVSIWQFNADSSGSQNAADNTAWYW